MKKFFLIAAAGMMTMSALAQPQLRKDNIDEVLKAMTLGLFLRQTEGFARVYSGEELYSRER